MEERSRLMAFIRVIGTTVLLIGLGMVLHPYLDKLQIFGVCLAVLGLFMVTTQE